MSEFTMKIASFNVKNLGRSKVSDTTVVKYLVKILSRYSVVVVLEVMDKNGEAMTQLLQELNSLNRTRPYLMTASSQLGRCTYKEKFVCFYRKDEVELVDSYQYEDNQSGDEDAFAREPFILRFRCPTAAVKDLVLIPVHTKPEDSWKELDELDDVVQHVREMWKTNKIMILGDFNADGRYLSGKKKEKIRIRSAPYHWLIDDDVDTTTRRCNDYTYDRIVVYGKTMLNAVVRGSAKSFDFQRAFRLSDEKALSISDHYPVEVRLKARPEPERKEPGARKTATKRKRGEKSAKRGGGAKRRRHNP